MEYTSARDNALRVSSAEAIITGLAPDGGLFVPVDVPAVDFKTLQGLAYPEVALHVLRVLLPDYDAAFLKGAIETSYGANFGGKAGYLAGQSEDLYSLELWHGPTAAFKDYALQLLPKMLVEAKKMLGDSSETLILVATSGDTGSAALAGYRDIAGVQIAVFYPNQGTSALQRLQMVTQEGNNVAVYAVRGNFDDAQRGVKAAFVNRELAEKLAAQNKKLSSANSINWGRLVPQIVYYATSYLALCEKGRISYGDKLDFCVPTGNFGDIMAGSYAKKMGLPVGRLICASNKNNVLTEFLETGRYNANRDFYKTSSPSMDILVSSNLERLLWHASGSDAAVRQWMDELAKNGSYTVDAEIMDEIRTTFSAGWADEASVYDEIRSIHKATGYLCDTHTAVAFKVARELGVGTKSSPVVVLSTASPYKFSREVLGALGQPVPDDEFKALQALEAFSGLVSPKTLSTLVGKPIRFTDIIDAGTIIDIPLSL